MIQKSHTAGAATSTIGIEMVAVGAIDRATKIGKISRWLKDGYSYTDVARKFGVSRQRVWQLARRHDLSLVPIFSPVEAARKWNCSESTVLNLIKRGVVRAERKRGHWNILTKENPRLCVICGKPIPKGRNKYCSGEHYELAMLESRKRGMWRRFRERRKKQDARK